jgi:hypothetical protein
MAEQGFCRGQRLQCRTPEFDSGCDCEMASAVCRGFWWRPRARSWGRRHALRANKNTPGVGPPGCPAVPG